MSSTMAQFEQILSIDNIPLYQNCLQDVDPMNILSIQDIHDNLDYPVDMDVDTEEDDFDLGGPMPIDFDASPPRRCTPFNPFVLATSGIAGIMGASFNPFVTNNQINHADTSFGFQPQHQAQVQSDVMEIGSQVYPVKMDLDPSSDCLHNRHNKPSDRRQLKGSSNKNNKNNKNNNKGRGARQSPPQNAPRGPRHTLGSRPERSPRGQTRPKSNLDNALDEICGSIRQDKRQQTSHSKPLCNNNSDQSSRYD